MIEQKIDDSKDHEVSLAFKLGNPIAITGSIFSTLGKVVLAVGVTGLLMFVFMSTEAVIGMGTLYTGASIIAGGLVTTMLGNRLSRGLWIGGLLSA